MLGLISMPTPSDIIATSTTWTTAFLPEFYVLIGVGVGLLVVGLVIRFVMRNVKGGVKRAFGSGGRRGRRRR